MPSCLYDAIKTAKLTNPACPIYAPIRAGAKKSTNAKSGWFHTGISPKIEPNTKNKITGKIKVKKEAVRERKKSLLSTNTNSVRLFILLNFN